MHKLKFRQEVSYNDSTGEPVAAYLRVREGRVAQTKEKIAGTAFADYAADGTLLGIELLSPCHVDMLDDISRGEPESVRRFLCDCVRRPFVTDLHPTPAA